MHRGGSESLCFALAQQQQLYQQSIALELVISLPMPCCMACGHIFRSSTCQGGGMP